MKRRKFHQRRPQGCKQVIRQWAKPLQFKRDPNDPLALILQNGTRIKQLDGVDIFTSRGGNAYSLTKFGLRKRRIDYCRKKNYGKRTSGGTTQGLRYPYITFRGKTYVIHLYMLLVWVGSRPEGCEADHITGNIDDFRLKNLRYIPVEENRRCARILKKLRKAAKERHDPSLNPERMEPERMLKIFAAEDPIAYAIAA